MPSSSGAMSNGRVSKSIDDATASASKFEGIIKSIEKSVDNIVKGLGGIKGVGGASTSMGGGIGGSGTSLFSTDVDASLRVAQAKLDQLLPRTNFEKGVGAAGIAASVAGYAYGMMPNTIDAVSQRITAQGVASISGMSATNLISSSNALLAGGTTGAQSAQASAAILTSRGILPTMGSYGNIMGQTAGFSVMTGQSNEQTASGFGSINGMNMLRVGINARTSSGDLRDPSAIASDLYRRMYGSRPVTAEQAAQVFNPNSKAYKSVMAAAGGNQELFNSLATSLVFQAKNGGKQLNMDPENVKNNILKLPEDDPMRKMYDYQQSEVKKLQVTGKGLVGGFGAALDATTAVNNGFSALAQSIGPVAEGFAKLKGFLDTLPTAGNTGATLFAAGGNVAGQVGANIQSKISEKITDDILKQLGISGGSGGGGLSIEDLASGGGYGGSGGAGGAAAPKGFKGLMTSGKSLLKSPTVKGLGLAAVGAVAGMGFDYIKNREAGKHSETTNRVGMTAARAGEYALKGAGAGMMIGTVVPGIGNAVGAGIGAVLGTAYGAYKGYTESTNSNFGGDSGPSSVSPASGPITARYGQKPKNNTYWKWKGYHTGTDWGVRKGTPVKSIQDGVVKEVGADPSNEPYGTRVLIDHGGFQSMYAHLSSYTVRPGQKVKAGDQIALSGQSGSGASMGPHLHFEIRKGRNNPVDPKNYLSGSIVGNGGGSGVSGFIENVKDKVGGVVDSIKDFVSGKDEPTTNIPGGSTGTAGATPQFSVGNTGFTMTSTGGTSSLAHGGDMGAPSGGMGSSIGVSGGQGITINMNVTVSKGNTEDAIRLARDVKKILERDLRVNTIASN
jgi:hypothetical protein